MITFEILTNTVAQIAERLNCSQESLWAKIGEELCYFTDTTISRPQMALEIVADYVRYKTGRGNYGRRDILADRQEALKAGGHLATISQRRRLHRDGSLTPARRRLAVVF